jgi:hypothetical protein
MALPAVEIAFPVSWTYWKKQTSAKNGSLRADLSERAF